MGEEYKVIKKLESWQWAYIICAVQHSENYDINDLSHIIVEGTDTEIGYIGDDTFELVEPDNPALKEHHNNILSIYNSALREFYRDKRIREGKGLVGLIFA